MWKMNFKSIENQIIYAFDTLKQEWIVFYPLNILNYAQLMTAAVALKT